MILLAHILLPFTYILLALLIKKASIKSRLAVLFATFNLLWALALLPIVQFKDIIVVQVGGWAAPYGISLVADRFSVFMLIMTAIVFFLVTIYATQSVDKARRKSGHFFFTFGILMGVNGSFIAGDIFNLYVWYEVMLMSSFILMSLGGERAQMEGSIKYLILNLISALFFVSGVGLLYGNLGTLNMADLSAIISEKSHMLTHLNPALILMVVSFAIKGALVPFFFWLPASYHTPPPAVSALLAGLLTKVGIYSLIRFYTLFLYHDAPFWNQLILWMGVLSMVIGVFAASSQFDFRKILSFHIISQVGYVVIGLGFYTVSGIAAAIFFLAHNMLSKTNAFLVAGWVKRQKGTLNLKTLGEVYKESPVWGVLFFISAFSLAGLPPLSGFIGKYLIIKAGIEANYIVVALIALFVGLFTLFSMVKIWLEVFWKDVPKDRVVKIPEKKRKSQYMLTASIIMAILIVAMGLWAQPIVTYCEQAAVDLLNPELYIDRVLNFSR
ncbi:proton-conducting transporter transmembrane domain-containing protein [Natronoflexus pectinivorans]|uniref:Multicomponent Na+:H+ antiporter subunit D n=1 Tax=Natronoflexus pectinivorans TaxID=682526 RepID=A0A4V2RWJ2_9BACT|nr:proton-conducting transporter membrane subunit [Natronoflexus pectinivorans]TCO08728.1 multicomponent Na+:H+ antiporter subunit D [Natronoflexus pectinivorans]